MHKNERKLPITKASTFRQAPVVRSHPTRSQTIKKRSNEWRRLVVPIERHRKLLLVYDANIDLHDRQKAFVWEVWKSGTDKRHHKENGKSTLKVWLKSTNSRRLMRLNQETDSQHLKLASKRQDCTINNCTCGAILFSNWSTCAEQFNSWVKYQETSTCEPRVIITCHIFIKLPAKYTFALNVDSITSAPVLSYSVSSLDCERKFCF